MNEQLLSNEIYHNEFLKLVTHDLPDMLWIKDTSGKYIYANEAICNGLLMADNIDEPIGKTDVFFATREREKHKDKKDWHTFGELCFNSDLIVLEEQKNMRFIEFGNVKGELLYLEVHKAPIYDKDGTLLGTIGVGRDITELKLQQNSLEEQAHIIQQANDAFIRTDSEGNILSWNPAAQKIFGFSKDEVLGININILYPQNDKDMLKQSILLINYQDEMRSTIELVHKNGTNIAIEQTISKLMNEDEANILFVLKDVTFNKQLTSEINKQEKIIYNQSHHVSVGQMIGNIAHQWRQPLSVITTSVSGMLLKKEVDSLSDESFDQTCNLVLQTSKYLSNTINDFQRFIKGERIFETFNISQNIQSCFNLQGPVLKDNHINIVKEFDETLELKGYPNELTQCFMNFINNSKDAFLMNNIAPKDRFIFIKMNKSDDQLEIKFNDSAGGAPEEVIQKVFDQYFTTKDEQSGTGLGLNMTYNLIVKGMNGNIEAQNELVEYKGKTYKGLCFTIHLPLNNK
jgi:PAS domain S-box-containing protein